MFRRRRCENARVERRRALSLADRTAGVSRITALLTLVLAYAYYLLLAGAVGTEQLVSAAVLTAVALCWSILIRRFGSARAFAFDARHLRPWARAIARLPVDTVRIGAIVARAALFGGSPGHALEPDFRFGPADDPSEAARRATAVIAGSLTPDAFVVDIAPGRSNAWCHKLARTATPHDAEWLV